MHVVIAGGHGKIALRLERLLAERGDSVVGLIRSAGQIGDLAKAGARGVVCDLETVSLEDLAGGLSGADAVVFAAGAGPGSGSSRKDSVDRGAAALLADAAELAGVPRYLMISTMGIEKAGAPGMEPEFTDYLRAKGAAEEDLKARSIGWTVLRPGPLLDEPGSGFVRLAVPALPLAPVPREDVALVLRELLDAPASAGRTLELTAGAEPVADAVRVALAVG
ncbi:NAD(P)H-binding protein [Kitasatospora sp. NPDC002040]|uniref:NAD(P)H-binding protein n=1 Tax=Kitasatospora sp. NPDC002040 TaxID=3154661 RepID=UPI00332CEFB1